MESYWQKLWKISKEPLTHRRASNISPSSLSSRHLSHGNFQAGKLWKVTNKNLTQYLPQHRNTRGAI